MFKFNKKHAIYLIMLLLSIIFAYYIFKNWNSVKNIVFPIIFSCLSAYILSPFVQYFESKGFSPTFSILAVYLIIGILVLLIVLYIIPLLSNELSLFFKMLPAYTTEIGNVVRKIKAEYLAYLPPEFENVINKNIYRLHKLFTAKVDDSIQGILALFQKILDIIIIPIITFYILKDKSIFKEELKDILPEKNKKLFLLILKDIDSVLSKYIRGQIYVSVFVTVFTILGLLIIKVKYAILIGILAGILNIIPYFGPMIGIIPAIMMGLLDSVYKGIWAFFVFIIVQQLENAILIPKIMSDSVGLHPITIIISLIIGEQFFGIWGLIFAVPIVAIVKVILKDVFIEV